jgi:acetylornithine deacetylase/succinyl-diaminopimelate desuccinylase-like protein
VSPMGAGSAPNDPASELLGDAPSLSLLQELVSIAPTNLEDPPSGRFEKPNYARAADAIVRAARQSGLATRIYDPVVEHGDPRFAGIPRPNVVVDLDRGARETIVVLAHFDVVPVPAEQRARWHSPPHTLTLRPDGRLYGRGANDDLGSGVVASLWALRRLAPNDRLDRNVRLLACCDEETGGSGGIDALVEHDHALPEGSPDRFVRGDLALIPDGSPHTTIGSSGIAFLEGARRPPGTLSDALRYGRLLVGLHEVAREWKSPCRSPDWPERGAPEPVITGRATVTKLDLELGAADGGVHLRAAHAESDAANQIAQAVTLQFQGPKEALGALRGQLEPFVPAPFRLADAGATALHPAPGALGLQVVGLAAHGGYPHRGHNPVPPTLEMLRRAVEGHLVADGPISVAKFTVDVRLVPEMELEDGTRAILAEAARRAGPDAGHVDLVAPPARCRPGYSLSPDHPAAVRLEKIVRAELGEAGLFGEYGGTDASSLRGLRTPAGSPLPALVFGSMDPASNIHDVDESVDPRRIAGVARTIERFVLER